MYAALGMHTCSEKTRVLGDSDYGTRSHTAEPRTIFLFAGLISLTALGQLRGYRGNWGQSGATGSSSGAALGQIGGSFIRKM